MVINAFQQAPKQSDKSKTDWYRLCTSSSAFVSFNKREFNDSRINEIEFAASAARAYSDLLKQKTLSCFNVDAARKASGYATKLIGIFPATGYLPDAAQTSQFLDGLKTLSTWDSRITPPDVLTAKGNPVIRLLIYKLAEEFCYSFGKPPNVPIIWNLVQIGWPEIDIKTIRYTAKESLFAYALDQANIRRDNLNKSLVKDQQMKNAEFSTKNIVKRLSENSSLNPVIHGAVNNGNSVCGDEAIYEQIKKSAKGLSNRNASSRIISFINSIIESEG